MREFMRLIIIIAVLSISIAYPTTSINCIYQPLGVSFGRIENIYWCNVDNSITITEPLTAITEITGFHDTANSRDHDHVEGFVAQNASIEYFPRNLENIFTNLCVIVVRNSSLLEIHREDLAGFSKLRHLNLSWNKLRVLEKDLFKYNEQLEYLWLFRNQITYVDAKVFDNLKKLTSLHFGKNVELGKVKSQVYDNRQEVVTLVKKVVETCFTMDFVFQDDFRVNRVFTKLNGDISSLRNETTMINGAINQLKSEIDDITETKTNLEAEKERISHEKSQIEAENSELNENLTDLIQNGRTIEAEKSVLEATKLNLESNLSSLSATLEEVKGEKAKSEAAFSDLKRNLTSLDLKITEIEARALNSTQENLRTINDKEIMINDLELKSHNQMQVITELRNDFSNLKLENLDLEKLKVSNEAVILQLQSKMSKLEGEITQLELKIVNHEGNISSILIELNECKKIGEDLTENLQTCTKSADECSESHKMSLTELENQNKINVNLHDEIAQLNTSFTEKRTLLEGDIEALRSNYAQLEENHENLNSEHENLKDNLERTTQTLKTCDESFKSSTQNYSSIVDALSLKVLQLNLDISDLNSMKTNNTVTIESLMSRVDEQTGDVEISNVKIYVAIGIIGMLTILNVITLIKAYGKKRSYYIDKMQLTTDSKYKNMSVDDLNDAGKTQHVDGGFCNPVYDDNEIGGIVEVETSLEGLHGVPNEDISTDL